MVSGCFSLKARPAGGRWVDCWYSGGMEAMVVIWDGTAQFSGLEADLVRRIDRSDWWR